MSRDTFLSLVTGRAGLSDRTLVRDLLHCGVRSESPVYDSEKDGDVRTHPFSRKGTGSCYKVRTGGRDTSSRVQTDSDWT